jgi:hypothetical protein
LEEVARGAGHEVLMDVDNSSAHVVGDPQRILGQQLRPHPFHLLNINVIILITYLII